MPRSATIRDDASIPEARPDQERGKRAEEVAKWYIRLNGFFTLSNYVIHPDSKRGGIAESEVDVVAVRFPHSFEPFSLPWQPFAGIGADDDSQLITKDIKDRITFIIVEVKSSQAKINPAWVDPNETVFQKILARCGLADDRTTEGKRRANEIKTSLKESGTWIEPADRGQFCPPERCYAVRWISISAGRNGRGNSASRSEPGGPVKISWADIAAFLFLRFSCGHDSKVPRVWDGAEKKRWIHPQWPLFGRLFAEWFVNAHDSRAEAVNQEKVANAIGSYIECGKFAR